jgi:hypothetical protein
MAAPPTWLATVDAAAGLGFPTEVDPAAPISDTLARPAVVGLAAVTALVVPPLHSSASVSPNDVPLPRPRPSVTPRP